MEISQRLEPEWFDTDGAGFLCAPLTASQRITVARHVDTDDFGQAILSAARFAVKDWRGITQNDRPVPFTAAAFDDLFANAEMATTLLPLGMFIINRSRFSADDEKKS